MSPDWFGPTAAAALTLAWIYGPGEYELGQLERLVAEGFAANRHVHYSDSYGRPRTSVRLRRSMVPGEELRCQVPLSASVTVNEAVVPSIEGWITVAARPEIWLLELGVDGGYVLPAVGVPLLQANRWQVAAADGRWLPAQLRLGGDVPPHTVGEPTRRLAMVRRGDGRWELPGPVLGHVAVEVAEQPELVPGESLAETDADAASQESYADVEPLGTGWWRTRHQLGLRYLAIKGAEPTSVWVEAAVRPSPAQGAFACSDEELTRIWAASAQTLRLCMQGLMVDGIKRDRMPWAGDQALSTMVNAYTVADPVIARDSSTASGAARHGFVNGIADYSLWWVVNNGLLNMFFGTPEGWVAEDQAERLHGVLERLDVHVGEDGVFRPGEELDAFHGAGAGSVFLDWGVSLEEGRDSTALQMLWVWALRSASEVLRRAAHPGAVRWSRLADRVEGLVRQAAWDPAARSWREYLDPGSRARTRYPDLLAVLAGVVPPGGAVVSPEGLPASGPVGTPFMSTFELLALLQLGEREEIVQRVRDWWGPMLAAGAQTFWEEFAHEGTELAMYGRPFGKSLCHAWSAGPAALLPHAVLGLRPLANGWSEFEVVPRLGGLEWAGAVVAVPGDGQILVVVQGGEVRVEVPPGLVLVQQGRRWTGPCLATWSLPGSG